MVNFKKIKKVLLLVFISPASLMLIIVLLNLAESPNIQSLNLKEISNITAIQNIENDLGPEVTLENSSFDYELVGYRSGSIDASVILKKNNKQYVVTLGENLEGVYKLIKIDQDEIIFRNGEKLYKIVNLVGKEN